MVVLLVARAFPRTREGKPVLMALHYAGRQFETKSGLKAGSATTNIYRSPAFKNTKLLPFVMASPPDVVLGSDVPQRMYCHLLCGLYRSQEVQEIGANFAYMIVEPFRLLERIWRDICTDIREGTVNERVSDPAIRSSVQEILSPNPDLADSIERECEKGWSGIIERLVPNLLHITSIFSGSMVPYIAPMRYYAGSVSLVSSNYGSSEALTAALNIDPQIPTENPTFTMMPDFAYYEFIPVYRDSTGSGYVEEEDVVGLTDVNVGQEYEILLTTVAGTMFCSRKISIENHVVEMDLFSTVFGILFHSWSSLLQEKFILRKDNNFRKCHVAPTYPGLIGFFRFVPLQARGHNQSHWLLQLNSSSGLCLSKGCSVECEH